MNPAELEVVAVVSSDFQENAYIVRRQGRNDCVVVDPGLDPDRIEAVLDRQGLVPAAIMNTHGHADHIAGNGYLKRRWPDCPIVIGDGDAPKLTDAMQNLSAPFGFALTSPPPDKTVSDGDRYSAAGLDFEVLSIPGHSVGHVVFVLKEESPAVVFVGDVIFSGSIGRTDFPDGNYRSLIDGIREKLFTLPEDTQLYPGHGPSTTVGQERRQNPFLA